MNGVRSLVQAGGPATGKIFAKTGTLAGADLFNGRFLLPLKALGGYMDAASGRRFAFSIVASNSVFSGIEGDSRPTTTSPRWPRSSSRASDGRQAAPRTSPRVSQDPPRSSAQSFRIKTSARPSLRPVCLRLAARATR